MRSILAGSAVLMLIVSMARAQQAPVAPVTHNGDGWAIAAPADWGLTPGAPFFLLTGDMRAGVPMMDGILSAVKAGLTMETFQNVTIDQQLQRDFKALKESGAYELLQDPVTEDLTLADGTKAKLQRSEFIRLSNRRLSIYQKLYCVDSRNRLLVFTGFITCSRPGRIYLNSVGLPAYVKAHVTSLVFDPAKLDLKQLQLAYDKHEWKRIAALAPAREGNDLIARNNYPAAIDAFRKAIALCNELPAAHNGLSWALLQLNDPKVVEEAVREASLAVQQTEEKDLAALDTLAHAHFKNGDKAKAIEAIEKALKLAPNHPDLKKSLEAFEQ
jgi:tetratricopeptide (TPR) repeat protein